MSVCHVYASRFHFVSVLQLVKASGTLTGLLDEAEELAKILAQMKQTLQGTHGMLLHYSQYLRLSQGPIPVEASDRQLSRVRRDPRTDVPTRYEHDRR